MAPPAPGAQPPALNRTLLPSRSPFCLTDHSKFPTTTPPHTRHRSPTLTPTDSNLCRGRTAAKRDPKGLTSPCRVSAGAGVAPVRGQPRSRLAAHYLTLPCGVFQPAPVYRCRKNGISPIQTPALDSPATLAIPPDLRSSPSTASIPHRTADGPIPKTRSAHSTTAHPSLPRTGLRRRRKRASHLFKHPPPPAQPPSPPRPISAPAPAPPRSLTARLTARSRNPACLPDHSPSPASAAAWSMCAHRHMYVTGDRGGVRSPPLTSVI